MDPAQQDATPSTVPAASLDGAYNLSHLGGLLTTACTEITRTATCTGGVPGQRPRHRGTVGAEQPFDPAPLWAQVAAGEVLELLGLTSWEACKLPFASWRSSVLAATNTSRLS